ncbi:MAG: EamA family transporter [Bacteroidota bacterium]
MLFLALAVSCSLGIAVIFKIAEQREMDRTALLTVNYAAAAALALALQGTGQAEAVTPGLVALGVTQGVLFIAGFWLFSLAIRQAGMGLAAGVMRLSVVIPVLASWAIWGEQPAALQFVGLALGGAAFVLVARPAGSTGKRASAEPARLGAESEAAGTEAADTEAADTEAAGTEAADTEAAGTEAAGTEAEDVGSARTVLLLALLFLSGGAVDTIMKAFGEGYAATVDESLFLLFVFGVAFLVGAVVVGWTGLRTRRWPQREVWGWGIVLGLINYGSADFLLRAVAVLSGPVVFPANSVSIVLGAALIGTLVWKERLSRANLAGLALAAVALVCLTAA